MQLFGSGWRYSAAILGVLSLLALLISPNVLQAGIKTGHHLLTAAAIVTLLGAAAMLTQLLRLALRRPEASLTWSAAVHLFRYRKTGWGKFRNSQKELRETEHCPEKFQLELLNKVEGLESVELFRKAHRMLPTEAVGASNEEMIRVWSDWVQIPHWLLQSWGLIAKRRLRKVAKLWVFPSSTAVDSVDRKLHQEAEIYTCPLMVYTEVHHQETALYLQALFNLLQTDVEYFEAQSTDLLQSYHQVLVTYWEYLCDDIERGRIWLPEGLTLTREQNHLFDRILTKNEKRAKELRDLRLKMTSWKGFLKVLWPNFSAVVISGPGGNSVVSKHLRESFLGDVIVFSPFLSTEKMLLGVNFEDPREKTPPRFTLLVKDNFFEFHPVRSDVDSQSLLLRELTIGQEYEVIVTSLPGLRRYRSGLVVKQVAMMDEMPLFEYCYRMVECLDCCEEFTTGALLHRSIDLALSRIKFLAPLLQFSVCDSDLLFKSDSESDRKYQFFLEFVTEEVNGDDEKQPRKLTGAHKFIFDEALQELSRKYASKRKAGKLAAMSVSIVRPGTFDKLRDMCLADNLGHGATPRVLQSSEHAKFLNENIFQ